MTVALITQLKSTNQRRASQGFIIVITQPPPGLCVSKCVGGESDSSRHRSVEELQNKRGPVSESSITSELSANTLLIAAHGHFQLH